MRRPTSMVVRVLPAGHLAVQSQTRPDCSYLVQRRGPADYICGCRAGRRGHSCWHVRAAGEGLVARMAAAAAREAGTEAGDIGNFSVLRPSSKYHQESTTSGHGPSGGGIVRRISGRLYAELALLVRPQAPVEEGTQELFHSWLIRRVGEAVLQLPGVLSQVIQLVGLPPRGVDELPLARARHDG